MNAKEYLMQVKQLNNKIKYIELEIEQIREDISLTSINLDGMPHSTKTSDPTGEKAVRLIEKITKYESRLMDAKARYWSKRCEVVETISKVSDPVLNELLYLRYVQFETFEGIAYKMSYSYVHTVRLHGKALEEVKKLI